MPIAHRRARGFRGARKASRSPDKIIDVSFACVGRMGMAGDITFFDVETPNRSNSKICSIGVVRTDAEGNVQYEDHFLIDP